MLDRGPTAKRSKRDSSLDGILLVDKDRDWTSHDVVAKVRSLSGQRKIGHTGTLDPSATGLLVLCLGQATRLVQLMTAASKTYVGLIQLGVETDTDDAEGKETAERPVPRIAQRELDQLASRFSGTISQVPPAYSAVKVDGRRAYAAARKGETLQLKAREVVVHSISLQPANGHSCLRIEVDCGAGTYIRSLARDIGRDLGCGAHLTRLRRTAVGRFPLEASLPIGALAALSESGRLSDALLPFDEGLGELDAALVSDATAADLSEGRVVEPPGAAGSENTRIFSPEGRLVGLGRVDARGRLVPVKMFRA